MLARVFGHSVVLEHVLRWVGWNLLLALIPVGLGYLFLTLVNRPSGRYSTVRFMAAGLVFGAWLAFVPNTCYLLTEWRHFIDSVVFIKIGFSGESNRSNAALSVASQAVFYSIYSGLGALCFALAIRPIERAARIAQIRWPSIALPLFLLLSLGVYLGLILRLNSWNIINHPQPVIGGITHVLESRMLLLALVVFGLMLWGLYEALDIWIDGVAERIERLKRRPAANAGAKVSRNQSVKP